MSSVDGEHDWRNLANRLDDKSKADYFRLNVPFEGDEPRLDDVRCMDELRRSVQLQPDGPRDRASIAFAILVASFFFELDRVPVFEANQYHCQGFVRCRNDPKAVLQSLGKTYSNLGFVTEFESLGTLTTEDICSSCHLYCKKVQFCVRHLDDVMHINLKAHGLEQRKISGFPHSMTWFIEQQQLDDPFGNVAHDVPGSYQCRACGVFDPGNTISRAGAKRNPKDLLGSPSVTPARVTSGANRKRKLDGPCEMQVVHKRGRLGQGLARYKR